MATCKKGGVEDSKKDRCQTNVRNIYWKRSYWGKLMSQVGYSVFEVPTQYPASDVQDAIGYMGVARMRETCTWDIDPRIISTIMVMKQVMDYVDHV